MSQPNRTQKQIAEKYKGNLDYFKKANWLRRLRFLLCLLALVGGIAGIVWFQRHGSNSFYNAGPLSAKHARQDCTACHAPEKGSVADLVSLAKGDPGAPSFGAIMGRLFDGNSRADFDKACLKCHVGFQLHRPDLSTVAIRDTLGEVSLAHAGACSACHREHQGPDRMSMPGSADCLACHSDPNRMRASSKKIDLHGKHRSKIAQVRETQPGIWQFIPPQRPQSSETERPRVFASFENGHPSFGYEQPGLRDPNSIKFNHQRHEGADIPKVNGKKLDCAYCHQPVGDGTYFQRVSYEVSCKACHSLLFDPKNPELTIPHGDPDSVRTYLRSLPFQYAELASKKGFKTQQESKAFIAQQMLQLKERVRSGEDFEKQIFFTANPYKAQPTAARVQFPGCAYCHEVKPSASGAPSIAKMVMPDRWLIHGEFPHAKHASVACADCHDARHSKETSDILMPPIKRCAECHRSQPSETPSLLASQIPGRLRASAECLSCHKFHPGPAVAAALELKSSP